MDELFQNKNDGTNNIDDKCKLVKQSFEKYYKQPILLPPMFIEVRNSSKKQDIALLKYLINCF